MSGATNCIHGSPCFAYSNIPDPTIPTLCNYRRIIKANDIGASPSNSDTFYAYELKKSSGTFSIPHPDPTKTCTHTLDHSFVEAPTEGDNLYKYRISSVGCQASLELPSYYKFLNKNTHIHTTPIGHFGDAYGQLTTDEKCIEFQTTQDGEYDVILIGTRKDIGATEKYRGPEKYSPNKHRKLH